MSVAQKVLGHAPCLRNLRQLHTGEAAVQDATLTRQQTRLCYALLIDIYGAGRSAVTYWRQLQAFSPHALKRETVTSIVVTLHISAPQKCMSRV